MCTCLSVYKTTADYIPVDLSRESGIAAYVQELAKLYPHGVDILVNNAGNFVELMLNDYHNLWQVTSSVFTALRYASVVYAMALCLSVTSRCSIKMAKRVISQTAPHDSPETSVFWYQKFCKI